MVLGTRPEAVKLASVVRAMRAGRAIEPVLCVTGQHRALLDPMIKAFALGKTIDLDLMRAGQTPSSVVGAALSALEPIVEELKPRAIMVQGDTASAFAGALAGFYAGVPVAHVEAGLRAPSHGAPMPEEGHRQLIARVARWHFAPTMTARAALVGEGIAPRRVHVTGNSGIDALIAVERRLAGSPAAAAACRAGFGFLDMTRPIVVATAHRRENHGARLEAICEGLRLIAWHEDAQLVVPVHPNPAVADTLRRWLGGVDGIHLIDPPGYRAFIWLLRAATLVVTDSGGIQEEAPVLGTPVLVLRDATERPEGVEAGVAALVGADPHAIAGAARAVLRDAGVRAWMSRPMRLYGDGDAGRSIARILAAELRPAERARPPARVAAAAG